MRAFEVLRQEHLDLATAGEDQITEWLCAVIENRFRQNGEVAGFHYDFYDYVTRAGHWVNYDGTAINKAPDLCFKLRNGEAGPRPVISQHHALFVEAKPVDSTHAAGGRYCDDGLVRFVRGDYAWAMQEAMMLAYARDGRTVATHLIPAMAEPARMGTLATETLPRVHATAIAPAEPQAEAIYISQHARSFPWPDGWGAACRITVYHLWHQCS